MADAEASRVKRSEMMSKSLYRCRSEPDGRLTWRTRGLRHRPADVNWSCHRSASTNQHPARGPCRERHTASVWWCRTEEGARDDQDEAQVKNTLSVHGLIRSFSNRVVTVVDPGSFCLPIGVGMGWWWWCGGGVAWRGVWYVMCGVWYVMYGVWYVVCGVWCVCVCGRGW